MWINQSRYLCLNCNEFSFSPEYQIKVDDVKKPTRISIKKIEKINVFKNDCINNVTAVVGSNGCGKTTLLEYIANRGCHNKFSSGEENSKFWEGEYNNQKSIYIFRNEKNVVVYHNLENEIKPIESNVDIEFIWNKDNSAISLDKFKSQLTIYLSNVNYINEGLSTFSKGDSYNINLHPNCIKLMADKFYLSMFDKVDELDIARTVLENQKGFEWHIVKRASELFQQLIDVYYYNYLFSVSKNNRNLDIGCIKKEILFKFDDIFEIADKTYHIDYAKIRDHVDGLQYNESKRFLEKRESFFKKYGEENIYGVIKNKDVKTLYINLLFEMYYYNDEYELPLINFCDNLYIQIKSNALKEYESYLEEIKELDDILSKYEDDVDYIGCKIKITECKGRSRNVNGKILSFISDRIIKVPEKKSYMLRYINIEPSKMSSGERAIQNLFSWFTMIPVLSEISKVENKTADKLLLLIDEIDIYVHPEGQRKLIDRLISMSSYILKNKEVQIILTSHSPFVLSDFPKSNIIYMKKDEEQGTAIVYSSETRRESFGANIYTLLNDAFFLEQGAVGEFARNKILKISDELNNGQSIHDSDYYKIFISMIGDELVRREMQRLYHNKYGLGVGIVDSSKSSDNKEELKRLKRQLLDSISAINKIIEDEK